MSKLIDKLNQNSRIAPSPLGFGRVQPAATKPKIYLIADIAQDKVSADNVAGADAGLVHIATQDSGSKALREASQSANGVIWGGWVKETNEIEELAKVADFIIFSASSPLTLFKNQETGKLLQIDATLGEDRLAAANDLPIDAIFLVNKTGDCLTWENLIIVRRTARLVSKPLLITVPPNLTSDELKALWKAGVDAIVVPSSSGKIKELRQLIDSLSFPLPRKPQRREALVPRLTGVAPEEQEEEEEDE